jgi:nickel-dependent lactate racemase
MRVVMRYGEKGLPLDLPDDWLVDVIAKKPMPVMADVDATLADALRDPLGDEAAGCRTACILVCDITRPVPNRLILPPLVTRLVDSGIAPEHVTVLVATGLHRPSTDDELEKLVGEWTLARVKVANHFARNDDDHSYLGETTRGTPVRLDRRFLDADLRIVIGLVEPHFMAGYSGGRKLIAPGIAHHSTITSFHRAELLSHPSAANCVLDGNPVHEELMEIASMAGKALAVNVVLDDERRLSFLNFGELVRSHSQAVEFLRPYAEVPIDHKYATVITSAAGYPLDKTYYQTVKGMVGAMDILAPGGNLFLVSECSEGVGSPEYVDAQRRLVRLGPAGFLAGIQHKRAASIDEWQTQMQVKPMLIGNVHLYSTGLSDADCILTGVRKADDIMKAVRAAVRRSDDTRIAVIPEGPYVTPIYRSLIGH